MEDFFNRLLCSVVGHKEKRIPYSLLDKISEEGMPFDPAKYEKTWNICKDDLGIQPSVIIQCKRCGEILENGPETFIKTYRFL